MLRTLTCLALLAGTLAGDALAGDPVIDINDYLRVGRFSKWRYQAVDENGQLLNDFRTVAVTNFNVVGDDLRYTVRFPAVGGIQFLFMTLSREPNGDLSIRALRIQDEELDEFGTSAPMFFDPPLLIGGASTPVGGAPTVFPVDTSFVVKVKFGPLSEKVTVDVTGTISINVLPPEGDVPTGIADLEDLDNPANLIPESELVILEILPQITLSVDESGIDEEAVIDDQIRMHLARDKGVVFLEEEGGVQNFGARVLIQGILPGTTVGAFPPNEDITEFSFPTLGALDLHGHSASSTTGGAATDKDGEPTGTLRLDNVALDHRIGGNLFMTADVSFAAPDAAAPGSVPVLFKGKARFNPKKGETRLILNGRTKPKEPLDGLTKPMVMRAKAVITEDTDSIPFVFRSGRDAMGTMELAISPVSSETADVVLDALVDIQFVPPKVRPLGSEGTMTVAGRSFPITVWEKKIVPKQVEGKPVKPTRRNYVMRQTGSLPVLAAFKAEELDELIDLTRFRARLFGGPIKVLDPDVEVDFEDSYEND